LSGRSEFIGTVRNGSTPVDPTAHHFLPFSEDPQYHPVFRKEQQAVEQVRDGVDKRQPASVKRRRGVGRWAAADFGRFSFFPDFRRNPLKRLKTGASFPPFFAFFRIFSHLFHLSEGDKRRK